MMVMMNDDELSDLNENVQEALLSPHLTHRQGAERAVNLITEKVSEEFKGLVGVVLRGTTAHIQRVPRNRRRWRF